MCVCVCVRERDICFGLILLDMCPIARPMKFDMNDCNSSSVTKYLAIRKGKDINTAMVASYKFTINVNYNRNPQIQKDLLNAAHKPTQ
jgi:hypothetical protein